MAWEIDFLSLIVAVVGVILSYIVARKYGDRSGTEAAIEYEEKKVAKAHIVLLRSLLNETIRIRDLAHRNSQLVRNQDTIQFVAKMPVSAFEAAFTSGGLNPNDLASDSELLSSVVSYLNEAASVNTLVDFYLGLVRGLSSAEQNKRRSLVNEIIDRSEHVIQVLGQLERCLTVELENAVSR